MICQKKLLFLSLLVCGGLNAEGMEDSLTEKTIIDSNCEKLNFTQTIPANTTLNFTLDQKTPLVIRVLGMISQKEEATITQFNIRGNCSYSKTWPNRAFYKLPSLPPANYPIKSTLNEVIYTLTLKPEAANLKITTKQNPVAIYNTKVNPDDISAE